MKTCNKCGEKGPLESFKKDKREPDGVTRVCKSCYNLKRRQERHLRLPTYIQVTGKSCTECGVYKPIDQYHASKYSATATASACRECRRAYNRAYDKKHPHLGRAKRANQRASFRRRDFGHNQRAEIREVYAEAVRLTKRTGVPHDVDHIVPLQGERVSGLHVLQNLQILPAGVNRSKSNKFEENE